MIHRLQCVAVALMAVVICAARPVDRADA